MKVNIEGLTDMTITFNTIGISLRGKTVAKSLDITNDNQLVELNVLKRNNLVSYEIIEGDQVCKKTITSVNEIEKVSSTDFFDAFSAEVMKKAGVAEFVQTTTDNSSSLIRIDAETDTKVKRRGRRRREVIEEKKAPPTIKRVKEIEEEVIIERPVDTLSGDEQKSTTTIMTSNGPKKVDMVHNLSGEISENEDRCKASMDSDETQDVRFIDSELDLDVTQRSGNSVVIGTGSGNTKSDTMKNTYTPESELPFLDLGIGDADSSDAFISLS